MTASFLCGGGARDPSGGQPTTSDWDRRRQVTHDRTVARPSIARTRQVTVTRVICGVDVSSTSLEAFVESAGPGRSFANNAEGIAALAAFCREQQVELVALEATGGYEKQPFALLWAQGVAVTILNPRAVRDFAKGMGLLEKTDRIDARIIARFAAVKGSAPCVPLSKQQEHLKALVTHLRQLTQMHVSQRNQGLLVTDKTVRSSIASLVKVLVKQKLRVAAKIAEVVASDPMWQELDRTFSHLFVLV